jgi:CubicO group peptidase (beta-lactamase class C family)
MNQITFPQENKNKLFDDYLSKYIENKNVPSISAGVLKDGKIQWIGVKGIADIEDNDPANIHSLYRIASITKPITAVAVLQLWEKGLIDIDKDVRFYLPDFPEKKWKLTTRQLLNHTAGIRSYKDGEFHNKKYYSSVAEAVKVFAYDSLIFEPGTKYEYTSLGYSLLGLIIEKVTKQPFEKYLSKNIFDPAGMKYTMLDKQQEIVPNRVKGYQKNFERKIKNAPLADLSIKSAGGGLLSTVEDILLFAKTLLDGKLIKHSTFNAMIKQTKLNNGSLVDYGLGIALDFKNDSLKSISHTGGGTGFSTMLLIEPEQKLAVVHLVNISDRNLGLPAEDLLRIETNNIEVVPQKTLSDDLMNSYLNLGIDSTITKLNYIYNNESNQYNLNETEAISFAKDLLGLNKPAAAIFYLRELVKIYPKSFTTMVALADAYYKDNNNGLALRHYRLAAQINQKDLHVNYMIRKLSTK